MCRQRAEAPQWESAQAPGTAEVGGGGKWGQQRLSGKAPVGDCLPVRVRIWGATRAVQGTVMDTGPPPASPGLTPMGLGFAAEAAPGRPFWGAGWSWDLPPAAPLPLSQVTLSPARPSLPTCLAMPEVPPRMAPSTPKPHALGSGPSEG